MAVLKTKVENGWDYVIDPTAISYVEQNLTNVQKDRARKNLDIYGLKDLYIQPNEPTEPQEGTIWLNTETELYPIGSIYISTLKTSPAELFGGSWEQIKDRFLLAKGDTHSEGSTGGAASVSYTPAGTVQGHALTVDEMPSHSHGFKYITAKLAEGTRFSRFTSDGTTTGSGIVTSTGGGAEHTHKFTGTKATITTMPPYLAVYIWKRTG